MGECCCGVDVVCVGCVYVELVFGFEVGVYEVGIGFVFWLL